MNGCRCDVVVLREPGLDDRSDVGIPLIAIEVLSPSSSRRERETKVPRLLAAGVTEVWIIDPDEVSIECWTSSGMRRVHADDVLRSAAVPGFELTSASLFTPPR